MIYLVVGENSYRARHETAKLIGGTDQSGVTRLDGIEASIEDIRLALSGVSLFGGDQTVVLSNVSQNTQLWPLFGDLIETADEAKMIICVERKLDKRTKTYRRLKVLATIIAADHWGERDQHEAETWVKSIAKQKKLALSKAQLHDIVQRAYSLDDDGKTIIDQERIYHALEALSLLDEIGDTAIDAVLSPSRQAHSYELLSRALGESPGPLADLLDRLRHSEEAYRVFASLASQWGQLVVMKFAGLPSSQLAADLGVHPYALQNIAKLTGHLSAPAVRKLTHELARLDRQQKTVAVDPWLQVERFVWQLHHAATVSR